MEQVTMSDPMSCALVVMPFVTLRLDGEKYTFHGQVQLHCLQDETESEQVIDKIPATCDYLCRSTLRNNAIIDSLHDIRFGGNDACRA